MSLFFPVAVLLAALVAGFFPASFMWAVPWIVPLLGVAMFGMGMTLSPEDFKPVLKSPKIIIVGLAAQYLIMSALAYLIVKVLGLPPALALGVILVGTCPGGTASNLMAFIARGDVALSVTMTACSTLVAPMLTPLLTLYLAGAWLEVNVLGMFLSILKIVIFPVVLGMTAHRLMGRRSQRLIKAVPLLSIAAIVIIVGGVVAVNAGNLRMAALGSVIAVIIHNVLGLSMGYLTARTFKFDIRQRRTFAFEVGLQNSGLAASLAKIHFAAMPEAMLPAALFSVWHNISGALLAGFWAREKNTQAVREPQTSSLPEDPAACS